MRRVGVMPTTMRRNYAHQHQCDVILTSHACWEDEQLLLCGIIAHAKSSVVHHPGLSAVGECKPADIQMECYIFVYRLNSFSFPKNMLQFIAEIMHPIRYLKAMQNESYFLLFCFVNLYNLSHTTPTLPYWSVLYPRFVYFGKYFLIIEYGILEG